MLDLASDLVTTLIKRDTNFHIHHYPSRFHFLYYSIGSDLCTLFEIVVSLPHCPGFFCDPVSARSTSLHPETVHARREKDMGGVFEKHPD